ncbi:polysaccharide pyruvyl transferase family protein [Nocardioides terrigena]|uniref:polysaccharide pyruvyl transferase family protein n=1 Tax=Nocardioides terrigena TaxID=424797 RepID=UPI000D326549|nr:polysaccharide pyruvyl transferase family protein [Nocardioides terrigena]
MKALGQVDLIGGWGYDNIGDEAILTGYLEALPVSRVYSNRPSRTRAAQMRTPHFASEHLVPLNTAARKQSADVLICGGGYLNGHWSREVGSKLRRIRRAVEGRTVTLHGVELRNLAESKYAADAAALVARSRVGVRDEKSAREARALGAGDVTVLPDSIALLQPHLNAYVREVPALRGKILVNLLDISGRSDSSEAEIDVARWADFSRSLLRTLGDRAIGLAASEQDAMFMASMGDLPIIRPRSTRGLASAIGSADALFSVRMHPSLLATMMNKPTVAVPYCGKVRPTLSKIGVESAISPCDDLEAVQTALSGYTDHSTSWGEAEFANRVWLAKTLPMGTQPSTIRQLDDL